MKYDKKCAARPLKNQGVILPSKRPTVLLRLDENVKSQLIELAKADDRSLQYLLEKVIKEWLADQSKSGKTSPSGKK